MAEPSKPGVASAPAPTPTPAQAKPAVPKEVPPKQNPVFRAMGIPNIRWRLPSRNWMIFWTITGSFTAAIVYDRRQKKAVQKKWCDLVAHIAQQPLPTGQMPRKITVFLSAPPGDGIGPSRQYFKDYIKPVLVAAAMDYDVIEGRKEGDVRYGTAEQIRRLRRKKGESGVALKEEEMDAAMAIELMREARGIDQEPGLRGDLVLGRHTWKEYIRGVHEGWLGPLDAPVEESIPEPKQELIPEPSPIHPPTEARTNDPAATLPSGGDAEEDKKPDEEKKLGEEKKAEEEAAKKKKPTPTPSYLPVSAYPSSQVSQHIPQTLGPSAAIHQQHILGFLKTPTRIYHFLNRRKLADDLGREAAAVVLAANRPYSYDESFASTSTSDPTESPQLSTRAPENDHSPSVVQTSATYEQQSILQGEEHYWHKSIRKPSPEGDTRERVLTNDMVFDPRIAQRMRRFEVSSDEEERANRIASGVEKSRFVEGEDLTKIKITVGDISED